MNLINTVSYYLNLIFGVTISIVLIAGGVLYYLLKVKKITARTEKINYDSFERRDSLEYVKFEDIVSEDDDALNSPGMVVLGNNTFVAGINVIGYNYASASAEERESTMVNAISFFNVVEKPIQMRQTVKSVDLSHNIEIHEDLLHASAVEMMEMKADYDTTLRAAEDYVDSPEQFAVYEKDILRLQRAIKAKEHEIAENEMVLRYLNSMAGRDSGDAQKINQIMFSFTYDSSEYTEELTKEEIYMKAFNELSTLARSYGEAITRCGCRYKRLSAGDLICLMRKHLYPLSADDVKLEDLFNASYNALFVTSNSLIQLEKEKIGEQEFDRRVKEYQKQQDELIHRQELDSRRETRLLLDETEAEVIEQQKQEAYS